MRPRASQNLSTERSACGSVLSQSKRAVRLALAKEMV